MTGTIRPLGTETAKPTLYLSCSEIVCEASSYELLTMGTSLRARTTAVMRNGRNVSLTPFAANGSFN